jgi:hypothetical protein
MKCFIQVQHAKRWKLNAYNARSLSQDPVPTVKSHLGGPERHLPLSPRAALQRSYT